MTLNQAILDAPAQAWSNIAAANPWLPAWHASVAFPWAVVISLVVLGLAHVIKHFVNHTVEHHNAYLIIIAAFLVIYVAAAFAVGSLNPALAAGS